MIPPSEYTDEHWREVLLNAGSWIAGNESRLIENESATPAPESSDVANTIDHTLLKLDATAEQIDKLCEEAKAHRFHTVCVRLNFVAQAVAALQGTGVRVACVVGFHEGTYTTHEKIREATAAVQAGAAELDMVLNRNTLCRSYRETYRELSALRAACPHPTVLKVIFETAQLSREDIAAASIIAGHAELDFVKTSTGFNGRGASLDDVRLMSTCCECLDSYETLWTSRNAAVRRVQVKASGGIRGYADAVAMMKAGATRLGTSGGVKIMHEAESSRSVGVAKHDEPAAY